MVGLQPAQAVLHRLHHVQPGEARSARAGAHGPEHLGGQDDSPSRAPAPRSRKARPIHSSEVPAPVLPRGVTPVAVGRVQEGQPPVQGEPWTMRLLSASSVRVPNIQQPRQSLGTRTPVAPRRRYAMSGRSVSPGASRTPGGGQRASSGAHDLPLVAVAARHSRLLVGGDERPPTPWSGSPWSRATGALEQHRAARLTGTGIACWSRTSPTPSSSIERRHWP